ncbi:hypothetical protein EYF80_054248 [Liparis tanakae]|uniref:Uncharacterized protein n=1 Tax=Liparis tanakae TaxID=230148 RepID=A0A4Z2F366_9TELE|nr:hypothetical protein EYF80_054248 [Liparis tanakae]
MRRPSAAEGGETRGCAAGDGRQPLRATSPSSSSPRQGERKRKGEHCDIGTCPQVATVCFIQPFMGTDASPMKALEDPSSP